MATDEEREAWKTDPDAAYAEAERRIEEARREGAKRLSFGSILSEVPLYALSTLPPALSDLGNLQTLDLDGTQVADIAPLENLRNLQRLDLDGTQVRDLMPLRSLDGLATAAQRESIPAVLHGLSYAGTPAAARPVFRDLVALDQPARTVETLQYLNGTHPRYGGPPPAPVPPEPPVTRDALRANPPALPVLRRGVADLDTAPPGDAPENPEDSELATLPRRQQYLAELVLPCEIGGTSAILSMHGDPYDKTSET